jgi:hypothetical protein
MKRATSLHGAEVPFELGARTVLVERATSAASAWGHVYMGQQSRVSRCSLIGI